MKKKQRIALYGHIVTEHGIQKGYVCLEGGTIADIGLFKPKGEVIDLGDSYIVPGFIDLHTHGVHFFLIDNGPDGLAGMCRILPKYGVTGFLPTTIPRRAGEDAAFLETLANTGTEGAEILGFHVEGPFLNLTGAMKAETLSGTDIPRVESLIRAAKPFKVIFSISPDVEGIEKLLPLMAAGNTPVFMTHTEATVKQAQAAIEAGVRHATHFYNVFPCPPVNEPGVRPCGAVEAVLADKRVSVDFILDGVHVDPVAVKMSMACKSQGEGCVCLITDSNIGAGLEPGRYTSGVNQEIEFAYKGGPARQVKDNLIAGSGLTMDLALRNAFKWLGISLSEAVKLVSTNPAKVLGLGNRKGKIAEGYDADLVILDENLNVLETWIAGEICYKNEILNNK